MRTFPRADKEDSDGGGWWLDPTFLQEIKGIAAHISNEDLQLEQVEAVLRAVMLKEFIDDGLPVKPSGSQS